MISRPTWSAVAPASRDTSHGPTGRRWVRTTSSRSAWSRLESLSRAPRSGSTSSRRTMSGVRDIGIAAPLTILGYPPWSDSRRAAVESGIPRTLCFLAGLFGALSGESRRAAMAQERDAYSGPFAALIDRGEERGCVDLKEVDELVQALELEDEDLAALYEQLHARHIELRDDCTRAGRARGADRRRPLRDRHDRHAAALPQRDRPPPAADPVRGDRSRQAHRARRSAPPRTA